MTDTKHTPEYLLMRQGLGGLYLEAPSQVVADLKDLFEKAIEAERDRLKAVNAVNAELLATLKELFAMVEGEVPSLLEDHHLQIRVLRAIERAEPGP